MQIQSPQELFKKLNQQLTSPQGESSGAPDAEAEFSQLLDKIAGHVKQALQQQPEFDFDYSAIPILPTVQQVKPEAKKEAKDKEPESRSGNQQSTSTVDTEETETKTDEEAAIVVAEQPVDSKTVTDSEIAPKEGTPLKTVSDVTLVETAASATEAVAQSATPTESARVDVTFGNTPVLKATNAQVTSSADTSGKVAATEKAPETMTDEPSSAELTAAFGEALQRRLSGTPDAEPQTSPSAGVSDGAKSAQLAAVPSFIQATNVAQNQRFLQIQADAGLEPSALGASSATQTSTASALALKTRDNQPAPDRDGNLANHQSGASKGQESSRRTEMARASASRLLEKVQSALEEVSRSRDGKTISVRLEPKELGSVRADVSLRDGSLHARIMAESPEVLAILRDKAGELQHALRKLGLDVAEITVAVQGDGQQFTELSTKHDSGSSDTPQTFSEDTQAFVAPSDPLTAQPNVKATPLNDHWVA